MNKVGGFTLPDIDIKTYRKATVINRGGVSMTADILSSKITPYIQGQLILLQKLQGNFHK
jgi:hypothetical protein